MSLARRISRLASDRRGVSAVEFALIAPLLITLYIGIVQVTLGLSADRKLTAAASTVADLVAQSESINGGGLADIFAAGDAVLQPYPSDGLSIRVTSLRADSAGNISLVWSQGRGMQHLVDYKSITPEGAKVLQIIGASRCNVLISGGTGSGKTTLLNCLTGFIGEEERVVTCEDAAELQLQQPHVVRLETRPPNLEGQGQVTMRDLVKNCLRMRPERIIVGEVRGPEAFDLLQAMGSGRKRQFRAGRRACCQPVDQLF